MARNVVSGTKYKIKPSPFGTTHDKSQTMMFRAFIIIAVTILTHSCVGQVPDEINKPNDLPEIQFYINKSVANTDGENEKAIINLWQDYLESREYQRPDGRYWSYESTPSPDQFLFRLQTFLSRPSDIKVQNNIIGIFPVAHDHYCLKTMLSSVNDTTGQVHLGYIITVYAKEIDGEFKLVNSPTYHRFIWEKRQVGNITYYIDPKHTFDDMQASKMNEFSQRIARAYELEPLAFDYFVSNHSRDIADLMGFEFMDTKYKPDQSGGMAETRSNTIYAGNNSEYYPHEVVHLYNHAKYPRQYHTWIDEGIATFYGGSGGYSLDWHLQKLQLFLSEEPDYELNDLDNLYADIPNGEHMTDFRYVIGGLLARLIYEKYGMQGLFDALQVGVTDDDYFQLLNDKLIVDRADFGDFVKEKVRQLEFID